jgi:hypothetical protein
VLPVIGGRLPAEVAVRLAVLGLVLLTGCGRQAPPPAPPPPKVSVVTVQAQAVPITTELPGRVAGYRTADVRPQVNGIILKRLFVEGSDVTTRPVTTAPLRRMLPPGHSRSATNRWSKQMPSAGKITTMPWPRTYRRRRRWKRHASI